MDDNNASVMVEERGTRKEEESLLMGKLKKMAVSWEKLLYAMGVSLALHKCFVMRVQWEWKGGKHQ